MKLRNIKQIIEVFDDEESEDWMKIRKERHFKGKKLQNLGGGWHCIA